MTEQLTLAAAAARDAGMAQVDQGTPEWWKTYADQFIEWYCRTHRTVFVDDLWDAGLQKPPSPRALGPRMQAASRAGWIRKSGEYRPSVRSNMTVKPVWDSLIYGGDE